VIGPFSTASPYCRPQRELCFPPCLIKRFNDSNFCTLAPRHTLVLRILQLKARALHLRESRKLFLASASLYRPSAFLSSSHGLQPHTQSNYRIAVLVNFSLAAVAHCGGKWRCCSVCYCFQRRRLNRKTSKAVERSVVYIDQDACGGRGALSCLKLFCLHLQMIS
jgi:hypothetical protein